MNEQKGMTRKQLAKAFIERGLEIDRAEAYGAYMDARVAELRHALWKIRDQSTDKWAAELADRALAIREKP